MFVFDKHDALQIKSIFVTLTNLLSRYWPTSFRTQVLMTEFENDAVRREMLRWTYWCSFQDKGSWWEYLYRPPWPPGCRTYPPPLADPPPLQSLSVSGQYTWNLSPAVDEGFRSGLQCLITKNSVLCSQCRSSCECSILISSTDNFESPAHKQLFYLLTFFLHWRSRTSAVFYMLLIRLHAKMTCIYHLKPINEAKNTSLKRILIFLPAQ